MKADYLDKLERIYEHDYKKLLLIPAFMIVFFLIIIGLTQASTGYPFYRDISLKGGSSITVYTSIEYNLNELITWSRSALSEDANVRILREPISGRIIGYDFEFSSIFEVEELKSIFQERFGFEMGDDVFSVGTQSPQIAGSFFFDAIIVLIFAFILETIIVLYIFRNFLPAMSIVFSTFIDLLLVVGLLDLIGFEVGLASIGAMLMLLGFSTDSDILLSTSIFKRQEGSLISRIKSALKTQLTMTIAALTAFSVMFFFSNVMIIKQIAIVLIFGILFDIMTTWILSAGLQRIYLERRK